MMNRLTIALIAILACQHRAAIAQQIAVQQPVIENFAVGTAVSVPDRGSMFLGGVNSAASGRSMYGPFRSNTALGWSQSASSATVHVYIHDLAEMDRAVLAAAGRSRQTPRIDPQIADRLERRDQSPAPAKQEVDHSPVAAQAERLAREAEARGKPAVAKLHWERAARHGSATAQSRLTALAAARHRR